MNEIKADIDHIKHDIEAIEDGSLEVKLTGIRLLGYHVGKLIIDLKNLFSCCSKRDE